MIIYNSNNKECEKYIKNIEKLLTKLNPYILKKINTPLNF